MLYFLFYWSFGWCCIASFELWVYSRFFSFYLVISIDSLENRFTFFFATLLMFHRRFCWCFFHYDGRGRSIGYKFGWGSRWCDFGWRLTFCKKWGFLNIFRWCFFHDGDACLIDLFPNFIDPINFLDIFSMII